MKAAIFWLTIVPACALPGPALAQVGMPGPSTPARTVATVPIPPLPRVKGTIAAPPQVADGKVTDLNQPVFAALQEIKRLNPGSLTQANAMTLRAAIVKDDRIDAAEADLLFEITRSAFRNITVTPVGAPASDGAKTMTFPAVGNAKTVLLRTLNPEVDLDAAWANGSPGWSQIIAASLESPEQDARVLKFVQGKIAEQWELSNSGNGYKPLRDLIGRYYGFSNSAGANTNAGRSLLYRACNGVDRAAADQLPDFFYNWLRPAGAN